MKKLIALFASFIILCMLNCTVIFISSLLFEKNTDAYKDVASLYEIVKGNSIDFPEEQMVLSNWTGNQSWRENGMPITKMHEGVINCKYIKCSKLETTIVKFLQSKYNSVLCFRYDVLKKDDYNQLTYSMEFIHLFGTDYILVDYNENRVKGETIRVLYKANESIYEYLLPYEEEILEFIRIPSDFWYKLNLHTSFTIIKYIINVGLFVLLFKKIDKTLGVTQGTVETTEKV